jgi:hypothetical protein
MMTGRQAAEQIQRAVDAAAAELVAEHGVVEVPHAMLRSAAAALAELTRVRDPRTVDAAVAGEFCDRLSHQLRGIDCDRIGERLRGLLAAVERNFPVVN